MIERLRGRPLWVRAAAVALMTALVAWLMGMTFDILTGSSVMSAARENVPVGVGVATGGLLLFYVLFSRADSERFGKF